MHILETLSKAIETCSNFLWGWPMIIMLLGTHLYLTVRLRFPQRKIFKAIRLSLQSDKSASGDVSQFGALVSHVGIHVPVQKDGLSCRQGGLHLRGGLMPVFSIQERH